MKFLKSKKLSVRDILKAAKNVVEPWDQNVEAEVLRAAKSYALRLRKLDRSDVARSKKQADARTYWLMTAPGAKLCAAILAAKPKFKQSLKAFADQVAEMNPRKSTGEPVRVIGAYQADGRIRPLTIAGRIASANQELVKTVYTAKLGHSEYEFSRRGRGREAVIRNTLQSIQKGETIHLVEADIREFFPSVNGQGIARFLGIPASIVQHTLLISPAIPIHIDKSLNISPRTVRRGLPMGFRTSPFFASKLIEPVLRQLGASITRSFIDNLGFGACSQMVADEKKDALAVLLRQHPVGPFELKYAITFTIDDESDILGYWVRRQDSRWIGVARATPSKPSIQRAQQKLVSKLCFVHSRCWESAIEDWSRDWALRYPVWGGRKNGATNAFIAAYDHVVPHVGKFNKERRGPFGSFSEMEADALAWGGALGPDPFYRPIGSWNQGVLAVKFPD